jgi:hypothetical protein
MAYMLAGKRGGNWFIDILRSPDMMFPAGAVLATPLKLGTKVLIAGSAVAATAAYSYFQKNGIGQTVEQKATAAAPTNYNFYQTPQGGPMNISGLSGGTAKTEQKSDQTASQTDLSGLLIAAVIAIGAFMVLRK